MLHEFQAESLIPRTDIGLYYFNARRYDPDLGRFISEDPARDPNNPNPYSYCGNNPVMRVDPTGEFWWVFPLLGGLDAYLCGGDFMQGFVMGAVTGVIGAGVSSFVSSAWGSALKTFGTQVVSGAIAGGITGELFGEGFGKGAVYGAIGGAINFGVDKRYGDFASKSTFNKVMVNGLKGRLNGLARGGDFIEGFAYGFAYGYAYEFAESNFVAAYAEGEPSKTVKTIAKKAGGCGRLFSDPDQAALDFAMRYNDDSIRSGCEYGASIFVVIDGNGTRWYTYTIPNRGIEHSVFRSFPENRDTVVAGIHTHGKFDTSFHYEDDFSRVDMWNADDERIGSYLATPCGNLRYSSEAEGFRHISSRIPSDPNAGEYRVNNVDPFTNSKNDPYHNPWLTNFRLRMIQPDDF
ncbi:MAG: DUF4329 domain-containing protein [Firmicutes bacterium]|nr:DUF4329 domain-containing protein [Bacillota bacterium]